MTAPGPRAVLLASGVCFAALTAAVVLLGTLPGDAAARDWLLGLASPGLIALARLVNYGGAWQLLLPATLLLLAAFPQARARWWAWIGLMLAAPAAEGLVKVLVGRPRPEEASLAFPSGHATAAAAFFGAVIYLAQALPPRTRRLVRACAVAAIVLVALARVMLRAHWPTDALAGVALGLALASAAALLASPRSRG